ncbi:hypothetical protein MAV100_20340 [Mycobacterium avium subsp. hominissuis 100]|nr:hypothetical protein MAV100_20340 [Mycobacterium avium subsp. hominissuis 100]
MRQREGDGLVDVKSTSSNVTGRSRHCSNTDPSMVHCSKVLCHNDVRRKVQLRKADARCRDSARLAPLKLHSVNTTRSVDSPTRSSSVKSCRSNSRSTHAVNWPTGWPARIR